MSLFVFVECSRDVNVKVILLVLSLLGKTGPNQDRFFVTGICNIMNRVALMTFCRLEATFLIVLRILEGMEIETFP